MNPVRQLEQFGQSVWLDFLSRELVRGNDLKVLIERDGLKGMTSNPSIFQKSIAHGIDYDEDIRRYAEAGEGIGTIFRHLSVKDIQDAADALRPVYDSTAGRDGFVSIEVSPYLAHDTSATLDEARSLWRAVERPNLMVKIPATHEGIPAIRTALGEGININITLLFSQAMYREVVEAYLSGLETLAQTQRLDKIASVASFFVSRIDTKADAALDEKLKSATGSNRDALERLKGKVAIANAKLAYQYYQQAFSGSRWEKLAARGARTQRLLWASTGTKNKAYSDVLYVESLIGADTVNTVPTETLDAFRDHGRAAATLDSGAEEARETLSALERAGISLDQITQDLIVEGVDLFAVAADKLFASLACKREKILDGQLLRLDVRPGDSTEEVDRGIDSWTKNGSVRRLWARDKSLWTGTDEDKWLGWLDIVQEESGNLDRIGAFAQDVRNRRLSDVVLLGMGGSSLGTAVLAEAFGRLEGWPRLHVLDSTDPDQIQSVENDITLERTLFIVASKSGSTLEPNLLKDHFFHLVSEKRSDAGAQFVAITDPGSALEEVANREQFAHIFHGKPSIGGRFSVLSAFGLVPAAAMGLDVRRLLQEAARAVTSSDPSVPAGTNPGIRLGVALGVLAAQCGRDKITLIASDSMSTLGAWLEQLIAESTGKLGRGLIPVYAEPLGDADSYGKDRVFVHLHMSGNRVPTELLSALEERGHPIIRLSIEDTYQFAQMFFIWEIAIAAAGAVLGINPFNQPDVEAQKQKTRETTKGFEQSGNLPAPQPVMAYDGIAVFADARNAKSLAGAKDLSSGLRSFLAQLGPKDYFALLAYIEQIEAHEHAIGAIRALVRDAKRAATVMGFGPRYLHSTGQAYKGGPNEGVFITVTGEHRAKIELGNRRLDFGTVQLAQALGDFEVLNERGRRAIRIHFADIEQGLHTLHEAITEALG